MSFVKLHCGILDSTLWTDRDLRDVFITGLLMATPRELTKETPQLKVGSLEETGFKVPPGWYGFIEAAGPGIVRRSLCEIKAGMDALSRLGEPDPESRSEDYGGRRMVRVDGGFIVLNYIRYRERDSTACDRARRYRENKKARDAASEPEKLVGVIPDASRRDCHAVTSTSHDDRHEAEAEAEAEADSKEKAVGIDESGSAQAPKAKKGTRLSPAWVLPDDWHAEARRVRTDASLPPVDIRLEAGKFRDFWVSKSGANACKLDWLATWRNWIRNATPPAGSRAPPRPDIAAANRAAGEAWLARQTDMEPT